MSDFKMPDLSGLMQQAQKMQEQLVRKQEALSKRYALPSRKRPSYKNQQS